MVASDMRMCNDHGEDRKGNEMKATEYTIINGYKVESGIPIPKLNRPTKKGKYPFGEMELNQSVFFPVERVDEKGRAKIMASARNAGLKNDRKFASRRVVEKVNGKETEGFRVWRIK